MDSRFQRIRRGTRHASIVLSCIAAIYGLGWLMLPAVAGYGYETSLSQWLEPVSRAWGEPGEIHAIPWSPPSVGYLACVTGLALLVIFTAWRAVLAMCVRSDGIRLGGIYLALAVLLTGSAYVSNMEAYGSESARGASLISHLQTIRTSLELYQIQHNGDYPRLDQLWDVMTKRTDVTGRVSDDADFGPYLQQPPINPFVGHARATVDNSGAWIYDEKTGYIAALLPPVAMYEMELNDCPNDVQAVEMEPYSSVWWNVWRIRTTQHIAGASNLAAPASLLIVWMLLTSLVVHTRVLRRHHALLLIVIAAAALTQLVAANLRQSGGMGLTLFLAGFALLIAWLLLVILQNGWDCIACWENNWRDPSHCRHCDYDLTGSLAAHRYECPECGAAVEEAESLAHTVARGMTGTL